MDIHFLLGILVVHFFGLLSPGPDFLLVIRTAMLYSKRQGVFVALGITLGSIIWSVLTVLGLNAFLKIYKNLDIALHLFGIIYLSYLIYGMLKNAFSGSFKKDINFDKSISAKGIFFTGLLTNLANPKAIMYYTLVLGSLLPNSGTNVQIIGLLLIALETLLWFSFVALSFSNKSIRRWYFAKQKLVDISSAFIFAVFVLLLALNLFSILK